jgi:cytochrome c-type biogenesis protein CcmH/NrfF
VSGVLWMIPLAAAVLGLLVVAYCAMLARREIDPTTRAIDRLGRDLRAALVRVRTDTERTRRRFDN